MEAMMQTEAAAPELADLNAKLDRLTELVAILTEEATRQRRQRQEWDELKSDMMPVMTEAYRLAVEQLDEVEQYVQIEDFLRLGKRLVRSTHRLEELLDQLESVSELSRDLGPLTQTAFLSLMNRMDEMERRGYFAFVREGAGIMDQIVASFSEEDVRQLGANIVLILQTVKQMTQPEIMQLLQNTVVATAAVGQEPAADVSWTSLIRQMNDPAVKRGLSKTLTVLKTVSDN